MPPKTTVAKSETRPRPHDEDEEEQVQGDTPNEIVRTVTGQPGQLAAPVPLNQIPSSNQVVRLNMSHKIGFEAH